ARSRRHASCSRDWSSDVCSSDLAKLAIPALAQRPFALAAAPLAASGLDAKTIPALHGMGLRTLGDLFALPRAELARRIGQHALSSEERRVGTQSRRRGAAADAAP